MCCNDKTENSLCVLHNNTILILHLNTKLILEKLKYRNYSNLKMKR